MIKIQFLICMHLIFWLETLQFSPSSQKKNILQSIWKWTNSPSNESISQHFYNIRKLHFLLHFVIIVPLQGLSIQIAKVTFIFLFSQHQVSPLVHLASSLWTNLFVPSWCLLPHLEPLCAPSHSFDTTVGQSTLSQTKLLTPTKNRESTTKITP